MVRGVPLVVGSGADYARNWSAWSGRVVRDAVNAKSTGDGDAKRDPFHLGHRAVRERGDTPGARGAENGGDRLAVCSHGFPLFVSGLWDSQRVGKTGPKATRLYMGAA